MSQLAVDFLDSRVDLNLTVCFIHTLSLQILAEAASQSANLPGDEALDHSKLFSSRRYPSWDFIPMNSDAVGVDGEWSWVDEGVEVDGTSIDTAWVIVLWVDDFDFNWVWSRRAWGTQRSTAIGDATRWEGRADDPGLTDSGYASDYDQK